MHAICLSWAVQWRATWQQDRQPARTCTPSPPAWHSRLPPSMETGRMPLVTTLDGLCASSTAHACVGNAAAVESRQHCPTTAAGALSRRRRRHEPSCARCSWILSQRYTAFPAKSKGTLPPRRHPPCMQVSLCTLFFYQGLPSSKEQPPSGGSTRTSCIGAASFWEGRIGDECWPS